MAKRKRVANMRIILEKAQDNKLQHRPSNRDAFMASTAHLPFSTIDDRKGEFYLILNRLHLPFSAILRRMTYPGSSTPAT